MIKLALVLAFALTIPAANWMIGNVGTECLPGGPCVIPVWPGIEAPSAVLMIGLALVLRDMVQRSAGLWWAVGAILLGGVLSVALAPPALAVASVTAFLFSEFADLAVYTPLARRRLGVAVIASGVVGAIVDSLLFLWLAYGSFDFLAGQVIGKLYASVLFGAWLMWRRPAALKAGN
jgi:uncharacterized PurR-regulated membrane protein YhhQ (DUF165 family)